MKAGILFPFLAALLLVGTGCSSFHREWRRSSDSNTTEVSGRWEGTWLSDVNGHNGKLRCIMKPLPDGSYEARFHAKYARIFSFGYTAHLTGTHENDTFRFLGEADLGRLAGGVYSYNGEANHTNFFSTYNSRYDNGTFRMTRPR
ncbi:MAG: hypothetical protein ACK4UN_12960 [Limisphaerales bacterium]